MTLRFLEFDLSEDTDGLRTWDALASPGAAHTRALLAEVRALTEHLQQALGASGPIDEGHAWDMALDIQQTPPRTTVSLHLSGRQALAEALAAWTGA